MAKKTRDVKKTKTKTKTKTKNRTKRFLGGSAAESKRSASPKKSDFDHLLNGFREGFEVLFGKNIDLEGLLARKPTDFARDSQKLTSHLIAILEHFKDKNPHKVQRVIRRLKQMHSDKLKNINHLGGGIRPENFDPDDMVDSATHTMNIIMQTSKNQTAIENALDLLLDSFD